MEQYPILERGKQLSELYFYGPMDSERLSHNLVFTITWYVAFQFIFIETVQESHLGSIESEEKLITRISNVAREVWICLEYFRKFASPAFIAVRYAVLLEVTL